MVTRHGLYKDFGLILTSCLGAVLLLIGCRHTTEQQPSTRILDPDADDNLGGTGTESQDIRSIAQRMSREIVGIQWPDSGAVPRIAVLPLNNQTRFRIDPKIIQNKLTKNLVNSAMGRVQFIARDTEAEVFAEREKKRSGIYDSGNTTQALAGADYFLKGEMRALSKAAQGGVSDYILYSFQLVNAENGILMWAGDYETKKAADTDVVYQ